DRVAAGRVRQQRVTVGRQHVEQAGLVRVLADVGAAHGHGDDLGAAGFHGAAGLIQVLVLAGADQQARLVFAACDDEPVFGRGGLLRGHALHGNPLQMLPPPMACTISSWSPAVTRCCSWRLRGTISPFSSTAMRRPARPRVSTSSLTVMPSRISMGCPLTIACIAISLS